MNKHINIQQAVSLLKSGRVIAYPTESVWGLGCDPFNDDAVQRIITIKGRQQNQGLICIAASVDQFAPFVGELDASRWAELNASWPGPVTWVCPAAESTPSLLRGEDGETVAIRVTNHTLCQVLCQRFGGPVVSTSANLHGQAPVCQVDSLSPEIVGAIDGILDGPVGGRDRPSKICRAIDGLVIRAG